MYHYHCGPTFAEITRAPILLQTLNTVHLKATWRNMCAAHMLRHWCIDQKKKKKNVRRHATRKNSCIVTASFSLTIKSAGGAVCCSSPFLLLSFCCIWDVHWLARLDLWSSTGIYDEFGKKYTRVHNSKMLWQISLPVYLLGLGRSAVFPLWCSHCPGCPLLGP